jgi:hypothetical protein
MQTYNGWASRETWLANLWYGETLQEYTCEHLNDLRSNGETIETYSVAEYLSDVFDEIICEEYEKIPPFFKDFINLEAINWLDLASTYMIDCIQEEE